MACNSRFIKTVNGKEPRVGLCINNANGDVNVSLTMEDGGQSGGIGDCG